MRLAPMTDLGSGWMSKTEAKRWLRLVTSLRLRGYLGGRMPYYDIDGLLRYVHLEDSRSNRELLHALCSGSRGRTGSALRLRVRCSAETVLATVLDRRQPHLRTLLAALEPAGPRQTLLLDRVS
jgi:hypothetical protein